MIKYDFKCDFNLDDCIKTLGLEERGKVQQVVTEQVLQLSEPFVPFDQGGLLASGRIENGTDVVWGGGEGVLYARYMWNGILYVDPETNSPFAPKYTQKVPTDRKLQYQGGGLRGPRWVERMLQNGGREKIEKAAREAVKR